MYNERLHVAELIKTKNMFDECGENMAATGRAMGMSRQAVQQRLVNYSKLFDDYIPKTVKIANYVREAEAIVERALADGHANLNALKKKEKIQLSNPTIAKRLNIKKDVLRESRAIKRKVDTKAAYLKLVEAHGTLSTARLIVIDRNLYAKIYYYWKNYEGFLKEVYE